MGDFVLQFGNTLIKIYALIVLDIVTCLRKKVSNY